MALQASQRGGAAGLTRSDIPHPHAAENDVIVRVHAAGFAPGSWTGRARGATAPAATKPRAFLDMSCRVLSPSWATAPLA
jgi:NADPH:quinone reductase-like Zn-dependent oxidoreductase